jgi:SAM-dependent methyltransferase
LESPLIEGLRWIWRRLPPRDPRFLLQRLETEEERRRLLASPHHAAFVRREGAHWSGLAQAPAGGARSDSENGASAPRRPVIADFQAHPVVQRHFHALACPETRDLWLWLAGRWQGLAAGLVLGAGEGNHSRLLVDLGVCRRVEAFDIAEGLVARVSAEHARLGYPIDYRVADLNRVELPAGRYGVCLALHALHHLIALERLAAELARALTPGEGWLVMDDYVGPRHLELPRSIRAHAQRMLERLPARLRRPADGGRPIERLAFANRWWTMKQSPFEAVRSDAILPVLRGHFEWEIERELGGGLMLGLLPAVIHNFDPDDDEANIWLETIARADQELTAAGEIPNCFAFAAGWPRAGAGISGG